jgi:O-antigen/teichoic acid export membrane protein
MDLANTKVRFLTTVATNVLRMAISFATGLIIARFLGPAEYGNFYFLLGSFTALTTLVNMSSSSAFYTFISQGRRGSIFFLYYSMWILIQFLFLLSLVLFLPITLKEKIWHGHSNGVIILALFTSFTMNQIWGYVGRIGESIRDTVGVQIRNIMVAVVYLVFLLSLFIFNLLSVKSLFILNSILYLLFAGLYAGRLYQKGIFSFEKSETFREIIDEFKTFCLPLILYTFVGFICTFADYWLLQNFAGSVEQGYYAISSRIAIISLIATTSILQVFWKEIAEAHASGNMQRVRDLYQRVIRGLYFVGGVCSCFLIPFSREILAAMLGFEYEDAWLPLSLMLLYPIHQSMGQILGTMFLATGQTRKQAYIGIFMMCLSTLAAYIVTAPKGITIPGLELGAVGMSLKKVFCQIIGVNIYAFTMSRFINISFDWSHQIIVLLILLPLGFLSKICSQFALSIVFLPQCFILNVVISSLLYLGILAVLVYFRPSIAGINRDIINSVLFWLRRRFRTA